MSERIKGKKPCYYTYGNKCPGLSSKSGRFMQKKCMHCEEFNGVTGRNGGSRRNK